MIGQAIRAIRDQMGMEGKDLAGMLGIHPSYLSRIENNKRNPSPALLSSVDMIAAERGVPSNLVGMSDVSDATARNVHIFMARDDISSLRKDSVRALVESILRME